MSPGRVILVLFRTKYAVPRQIKLGILKLTIRRGQNNFSIVFIFGTCKEKGYNRVVSVGQVLNQYRLSSFYQFASCFLLAVQGTLGVQGKVLRDDLSVLVVIVSLSSRKREAPDRQ